MKKKRPPKVRPRDVKPGHVLVKSDRYGDHERQERFHDSEPTINDVFRTNANRTALFNQLAKTIHEPLRDQRIDGGLWSRMLSHFFSSAKETGKIAPECLLGLECNEKHPVGEVLKDGYQLSVSSLRKKLRVSLQLSGHPIIEDKVPRDGYSIRFIALFPDFEVFKSEKVVLDSPVFSYADDPASVELNFPMPLRKSPYVLLMTMRSQYRGSTDVTAAKEYFLKVVSMG